MINLLNELDTSISNLRQSKPLVLCLTNFVTVDFMANSLLALGAIPLMTQSLDEIDELVTLSQAVNINLGTLDSNFCDRALRAAQIAKEQKKPVILDPVGAGASQLRTKAAKYLVPYADIIRGNATEIMALVGEDSNTKGVESSHKVSQAVTAAQKITTSPDKVVVVSGPVDYLTNGLQEANLPFGSPLMPLITGMGCSLTAVIAAFAATNLTRYKASLLATAYFGLCGQLAYTRTETPGSYRQLFIDSLFRPDWALFSEFMLTGSTTEEL